MFPHKHRCFPAFLLILALWGSGCVYESPVSPKPAGPVRPEFLGRWSSEPGDGKESEPLVVLPWSANEYLIHYPASADGLFFRAWHIEIDGKDALQLHWLGGAKGMVPADSANRFHLASVTVHDGKLTLALVNPDLVDRGLRSPAQLAEAFRLHAKDPKLWETKSVFRSVSPHP